MVWHPDCYEQYTGNRVFGSKAKFKTLCDAGLVACLHGGHIDPSKSDLYFYSQTRVVRKKSTGAAGAGAAWGVKGDYETADTAKVLKMVRLVGEHFKLIIGNEYAVIQEDLSELPGSLYSIRVPGGSLWVRKDLFVDVAAGFPKKIIAISSHDVIKKGNTYTATKLAGVIYDITLPNDTTYRASISLFEDWHPYMVEVIDTDDGKFHIGAAYTVDGETATEYLLKGTERSFPWFNKKHFRKDAEVPSDQQPFYVRCTNHAFSGGKLNQNQVFLVESSDKDNYVLAGAGTFEKTRFTPVSGDERIVKCIDADFQNITPETELVQGAIYVRDETRDRGGKSEDIFLAGFTFSYGAYRFEYVDRDTKEMKAVLEEAAHQAKTQMEKADTAANAMNAAQAAESLKPIIKKMVNDAVATGIDKNKMAEDIALKVLDKVQSVIVTTVEIKLPDGATQNIGVQHKQFPILLKAVAARVNVWLAGPSASGKTTAAIQVAKALNLPFKFTGAVGDAYALLGYNDAQGRYVRTQFREAWEHGGVFLWDEVDASDPNALLAFNAALANDMAPFPDGIIQKHKDCVLVAAANTFGHGATHEYVGRLKMDAAFLKRFAFLSWDYDDNLEMATAPNKEWTKRVQQVRKMVQTSGLRVLVTPRESYIGAQLLAAGIPQITVEDMTIRSGMTVEQWKSINNPSIAGSRVDVQAYLAGSPMSMRRKVANDLQVRSVNIYVSTTCAGIISAANMLKRGSTIIALLQFLQMQQIAVELYLLAETHGRTDGDFVQVIQVESHPLNLSTASFAIAHPAFARQITYAVAYKLDGFNGHWGRARGETGTSKKYQQLLADEIGLLPDDIYVPAASYYDSDIMNSPDKWLEKQIIKIKKEQL